MSANLPSGLTEAAAVTGADMRAEGWPWLKAVLAAFFAAAAVMLASFLSVTTNL
jgi:hypothetical protein